jgi:hypothetical protein
MTSAAAPASPPTGGASAAGGRSARKTVGVIASAPGAQDLRLFEWLGHVFPLRFEQRTASNMESLDGAVYLGQGPRTESSLPSLTFLGEGPGKTSASDVIEFSADALTPERLRGRSAPQRFSCQPKPMNPAPGAAILASSGGQPVWTAISTASGRADFTACRLPEVDFNPSFFEYFHGGNFFNLLPLVDFARRLTGEDRWAPPPLRACFMFDDPWTAGSPAAGPPVFLSNTNRGFRFWSTATTICAAN